MVTKKNILRLLEYFMFVIFKQHRDCHFIEITFDSKQLCKKNHQILLKISCFLKKIRSRKNLKSEKYFWKFFIENHIENQSFGN